jgi:predicted alpha/beta-hydrolase family hydrolase
VRAVLETAVDEFSGVPVLAGGKSMGGRMTSSAAARKPLAGIAGLAFLGFPLHPPGKPGTARADHLAALDLPMLFLQGTRDAFARLDILRPVCERLGRRAALHIVEGGDHSFNVLKRSGRKPEEVMEELAGALAEWGDNATQSTPT